MRREIPSISVLLMILLLATMPSFVAAQEIVQRESAWPSSVWQTESPAVAGLSDDELATLEQRLQNETPLLSAMLIVHDGRLVYERYGAAYDPDEPLHVWSVSKSITNMAVGFALQERLLESLDQSIGELIPHRIPEGVDPRVPGITVEQLLTMTAGWAWDSRINFARAPETDDLDLMLRRPLQCEPGTCFEYDSGCSNVLAAIIEDLSGERMVEYLQPRLFDPLGIDPPDWIVTVSDVNRGGGGAFLTPRDMARLGLLYQRGGVWDGERLLDLRWVSRSTREHSSGNSFLSGANIGTGPYGYHWWVARPAGYDGFAAIGYGGQMIYVVPDLELVVVTAFADADPARPDLQQRVKPIIEEFLIPAISPT